MQFMKNKNFNSLKFESASDKDTEIFKVLNKTRAKLLLNNKNKLLIWNGWNLVSGKKDDGEFKSFSLPVSFELC